ncbi:tryptophan-rich sensory protein [Clostridium pascui]|uniref:TspO/MBR family protein n=1 Tax=Clostridium pascui TaxID=46609 RepID=UPI00195C0536|nr:TspO/MBR family protein [Clostridium pascui]MBM7869949.1 tryptophan-rich sensory protein [Clostridium pascui]
MKNIFKVDGKRNIPLLISIIILTEGIAALSSYFGMSNRETYSNLITPPFAPPGWVFAVVWPILYLLMSIALYRILLLKKEGKYVTRALVYYFIQFGLNLLWTFIFFRFNLYGLAFIELLVLLVFILLTTFEFAKHDKISAYLLIPYILWVSFAGVLNLSIWMLNEM